MNTDSNITLITYVNSHQIITRVIVCDKDFYVTCFVTQLVGFVNTIVFNLIEVFMQMVLVVLISLNYAYHRGMFVSVMAE